MADKSLDDHAIEWVLAAVGGDRVISVRGLRQGGSPWLVRYDASGRERAAVLRVGNPETIAVQRREERGIGLADAAGIPVAAVIASRADLLLIDYVDGSSVQPIEPDPVRLNALGAVAARISTIDVNGADLPAVIHPIPLVDFDELRERFAPQPLLVAAQKRVANTVPNDPVGFVHGDLWSGNTLWRGAEIAAVIDWDCAGIGAAGVDLGSLRCDAAMCYGIDAAEFVLDGWEQAAGKSAASVAYWDAVAALSTPPEIDWFADAIPDMTGRPDLTKELLRERRDAFLERAVDLLG